MDDESIALFSNERFLDDLNATTKIVTGELASQAGSASEPSPLRCEISDGDVNIQCQAYTSRANDGSSATMQRVAPQDSTALAQIQAIFDRCVDSLASEGQQLEVSLLSRRACAPLGLLDSSVPVSINDRTFRFPGKSIEEASRFTMIMRVLEMIHEALRENKVISKRDIYYRDPVLFGSQALVDRYVDDIAFTFGVSRAALNVTAAAKGLIAGGVTFCFRDGSMVNASESREGILTPALRDVLSLNMDAIQWILVIEKEASFRSIAASAFWEDILARGIIITAKGYPDISTRALLRFLSEPTPRNGFMAPRIFGLVDFDPDGVAILATYKYGSAALAHESASLCVPQLRWLGLRSEHICSISSRKQSNEGLLSLTARDRRKAILMLKRYPDVKVQQALRTMLMLNVKAELQLLDAAEDGYGMFELLSDLIY